MDIIKDWLKTILYAVLIVILLYFVAWPVTIEGESMEHTLADGDKVVTSRVLTLLGQYDVGDIVVFHMEDKDGERDVIKRVIGVAGDRIQIAKGNVLRNGEAIAQEQEYAVGTTEGEIDVTVPRGELFVLGDNRLYSYDSRELGTISEKELKGKVVLRWYPFHKIRVFTNTI